MYTTTLAIGPPTGNGGEAKSCVGPKTACPSRHTNDLRCKKGLALASTVYTHPTYTYNIVLSSGDRVYNIVQCIDAVTMSIFVSQENVFNLSYPVCNTKIVCDREYVM